MEENVLRKKGTVLGYRPDIKVLDCTVRDGGLVNNSYFEDDFVRAVYDANLAAGVDYIGHQGNIFHLMNMAYGNFLTRKT